MVIQNVPKISAVYPVRKSKMGTQFFRNNLIFLCVSPVSKKNAKPSVSIKAVDN